MIGMFMVGCGLGGIVFGALSYFHGYRDGSRDTERRISLGRRLERL